MSPLGATVMNRNASVFFPIFRPFVRLSATTSARKPAGSVMAPLPGSGEGKAARTDAAAAARRRRRPAANGVGSESRRFMAGGGWENSATEAKDGFVDVV